MKNTNETLSWGIIGGGNGGQAISGYLGSKGLAVRLYDIFPETVDLINKQAGVQLSGVINDFGKVEATTNIENVVSDSDVILVVTPAHAHRQVAKECVPFFKDGQIIVLVPGSTGGAIEFYKEIKKSSIQKDIIVAETQSLFYSCRASKPGNVEIFGIKNELLLAALPSSKTEHVIEILKDKFPQIIPAKNVLETSFENINAMLHPLPALLNASRIEGEVPFLHYMDGITPSIGNMIEKIDEERIRVGDALGLKLQTVNEWLRRFYQSEGENLYELVKNNNSYKNIQSPLTLNNRFFMEDIPMGLIPMVSFAEKLGISTPNMNAVIQLIKELVEEEFIKSGRSLENLGISDYTKSEIIKLVNRG